MKNTELLTSELIVRSVEAFGDGAAEIVAHFVERYGYEVTAACIMFNSQVRGITLLADAAPVAVREAPFEELIAGLKSNEIAIQLISLARGGVEIAPEAFTHTAYEINKALMGVLVATNREINDSSPQLH